MRFWGRLVSLKAPPKEAGGGSYNDDAYDPQHMALKTTSQVSGVKALEQPSVLVSTMHRIDLENIPRQSHPYP